MVWSKNIGPEEMDFISGPDSFRTNQIIFDADYLLSGFLLKQFAQLFKRRKRVCFNITIIQKSAAE